MNLAPESPEVFVVLNSLVAAIGTLSTAAQKITAVARPLSEMFRRAACVVDQFFVSGIPRHRMGSAIKAMAVA